MPLGHELGHLAVEKGHQEGPDVRTVDVGVAHHHDLAVPPFGGIFFLANAVADGGDDVADLFVAQDAVEPGSLDVQDLTTQRKDCLIDPVSAPFGRSAGRVSLDQKELTGILVMSGTVHQLARQSATREDSLAVTDQLARLAGCLAGLGRQLCLADDPLGHGWVGLEELGQPLVDDPWP